jgi:lysophospholipase L1-like esterase
MDLKSSSPLGRLVLISVPALLLATVALAAVVEMWTRAKWDPRKGMPGFFESDPVRRQRLAPGYTGWFAGVPVHINSLGFRDDREYSLAKKPSTFRILVLGDSVTFGHGSVGEHTYPFLLEQQLKAWRPDVDWQVWNLGVPGYNTSQELAHLLQVGPAYHPDLVIVGFFENDLIDNFPVRPASRAEEAAATVKSLLRRHVYSLELYKRLYLGVLWRFAQQNEYRRRIEHLGVEDELLADTGQVADLQQQRLTPFDRLTDAAVAAIDCVYGEKPNPDTIPSMQRDPAWDDWLQSVRGFQQLQRLGEYRVLFFLNVVPPVCPDGDVYYDGGSADLNRFYLRIMSETTPAVSAYDEFRHLRPSQMPKARAHAIGNSNLAKANVLFSYLRDQLMPRLDDPRLRRLTEPRPTP